MGEGYAIRTKRDQAGVVRSNLLPESAYVEFAQFSEDDDLFIVGHVRQITRDELDVMVSCRVERSCTSLGCSSQTQR